MACASIWGPMKPKGINENGLLVRQVFQVFLNDLWPDAQDVVTLPVSDEVQEVHGLHHIISADACLLRDLPD